MLLRCDIMYGEHLIMRIEGATGIFAEDILPEFLQRLPKSGIGMLKLIQDRILPSEGSAADEVINEMKCRKCDIFDILRITRGSAEADQFWLRYENDDYNYFSTKYFSSTFLIVDKKDVYSQV